MPVLVHPTKIPCHIAVTGEIEEIQCLKGRRVSY